MQQRVYQKLHPSFCSDLSNSGQRKAQGISSDQRAGTGKTCATPANPERTAAVEESAIGRHIAPNSLSDPGQQKTNLLRQRPCPSPPNCGGGGNMAASKRSSSTKPWDSGEEPTSPKRLNENFSTDAENTKSTANKGSRPPDTPIAQEDPDQLVKIITADTLHTYTIQKDLNKQEILIEALLTRVEFENFEMNMCFKKCTYAVFSEQIRLVEVKDKNKQYGFVFFKDKKGQFTKPGDTFYPKDKGKTHSEEQIVEILQKKEKTGEIMNYSEIWIYTYYSPCLMRNNKADHKPCMNIIEELSCSMFKQYGIKMYIGFSICYGNRGKNIKTMKKFKGENYKESILSQKLETFRKKIKSSGKLKFPMNKESKPYLKIFDTNTLNDIKENLPKKNLEGFQKVISDFRSNIISPDLNSLHTFKEWEEIFREKAKQLELELKDKLKNKLEVDNNNTEIITELYRNTFNSWWEEKLKNSYEEAVDERLSDFINEMAVLFHMKDNDKYRHHLLIGRIE